MTDLGQNNGAGLRSDQFSRRAPDSLSRSALEALAGGSLPPSSVNGATADTQLAFSTGTDTDQESTRLRKRVTGPSQRRFVQRVTLDNSRVRVTKRYEGVVVGLDDEGYFQAQLGDPGQRPHLLADFAMGEVSPHDLDLVAPGAPFYVIIGRLLSGGSQSSTVTTVRFKRAGALRQVDVEFHLERGAKNRALLGLDE